MGKRIFYKCTNCGFVHETKLLSENYYVCNICGNYEKLHWDTRINHLVDEHSFKEMDGDFGFHDPIFFPNYKEKYDSSAMSTSLKEAVITGTAAIEGRPVMIGVMDSRFMMGSMGIVVGEKITRLFEQATVDRKPVIIFSASGGARMQEGIFALMQMAKTASAVAKYSESGGLYISILTNPTTGGVSASFAFLGDIILAEPKALIGFAGKRVIEQTIKENVPKEFQSSEFLLEHGFLDAIIERKNLRKVIGQILNLHNYQPSKVI